MTVNILGIPYKVTKKKYDDDPFFAEKSFDGYCSEFTKQIVYCDMRTFPGWENEDQEAIKACEKGTLRHEIVHAFLNESGLSFSASHIHGPWSKCEELVDWIALQGPKIYRAWKAVGAVEQ